MTHRGEVHRDALDSGRRHARSSLPLFPGLYLLPTHPGRRLLAVIACAPLKWVTLP